VVHDEALFPSRIPPNGSTVGLAVSNIGAMRPKVGLDLTTHIVEVLCKKDCGFEAELVLYSRRRPETNHTVVERVGGSREN
jgi:hypothetical protein